MDESMDAVVWEETRPIIRGRFSSLDVAVDQLRVLLRDYPDGFFTLNDQWRGDEREFVFSYFPRDRAA